MKQRIEIQNNWRLPLFELEGAPGMKLGKLRNFVETVQDAVATKPGEAELLESLRPHMAELIAEDDWLPDHFAQPHPRYYQQYLLHCDPMQRFSVVSFVWAPGQQTPIHNHTVWGMIGMLRGGELSTQFSFDEDGALEEGETSRLEPGEIEMVSPDIGDIHQVRNVFSDRTSISIHMYGANIGAVRRNVFDRETGARKEFISGFSSDVMPNIWS